MLSLSEQIGNDPVNPSTVIGDDQHFRGAGEHVDPNISINLFFSGRHKNIAWTTDFIHRSNGLGAVGHRRNGLRAAHDPNLINPSIMGRGEEDRAHRTTFSRRC